MLGGRTVDPKTDFKGAFADRGGVRKESALTWIAVGTNEPERVRAGLNGLHTSLQEAKIEDVFFESSGTDQESQTWRRDLKDFALRLL